VKKYTLVCDCWDEAIEAKDIAEAREKARAWAKEGVWPGPCCVRVDIVPEDPEEEEESVWVGVAGCPYPEGCDRVPMPCRLGEYSHCPEEVEQDGGAKGEA